jgi:hypothetical protein
MDRMEPFRETFDVYSHQHPVLGLTKGSGANTFSLGVLDISARLVLRVSARRVDREE